MFNLNLFNIACNPSSFILAVFFIKIIKEATSSEDAGHPKFSPFTKLSPNNFPFLSSTIKKGKPAFSPLYFFKNSAAPVYYCNDYWCWRGGPAVATTPSCKCDGGDIGPCRRTVRLVCHGRNAGHASAQFSAG